MGIYPGVAKYYQYTSYSIGRTTKQTSSRYMGTCKRVLNTRLRDVILIFKANFFLTRKDNLSHHFFFCVRPRSLDFKNFGWEISFQITFFFCMCRSFILLQTIERGLMRNVELDGTHEAVKLDFALSMGRSQLLKKPQIY